MKVVSFAALAWKYPAALLPHANLELPHKIFEQAGKVREAFSLWADDTSRHEFLGQLKWHTSLDRSVLPSHLPQQEIYFPSDIITSLPDEVFVDCGAFDGDTVREFIKCRKSAFGKIVAIEPDPINCQTLNNHLTTLPDDIKNKILTMQNAVGAYREIARFDATGTAASSIGNGAYDVECAPLDELLAGYLPTYIKMDIEGAESDAIRGARNLIARATPVFAICVYHRQEHLWEIPLLIRSFSDQYKFFFRRYADECWELVCYAIPLDRLRNNNAL